MNENRFMSDSEYFIKNDVIKRFDCSFKGKPMDVKVNWDWHTNEILSNLNFDYSTCLNKQKFSA